MRGLCFGLVTGAALALSGCEKGPVCGEGTTEKDGTCVPSEQTPADSDGDGVVESDDCNDQDATIYPGAIELCDGIDNNCDEVIDEDAVDLIEFYADDDGDGFGDSSAREWGCEPSAGFVEDSTDCDDTNADVSPGADEICNEIDDNCDGTVDEDTAVDVLAWYADVDLDGYGDASTETFSCAQPSGMVADNTDCDDAVGETYPGADEICNGTDDNCDTVVDEDTAVDAPTWYADADSDTYGDPSATHVSCAAPPGYVADGADCNDGDSSINPSADELCSSPGVDDDCDAEIDENGAADALVFYSDTDGDTYGDANNVVFACALSSGASETATSAPAALIEPGTLVHSDVITLAGCGTLSALRVTTDITHSYRGDLQIQLSSPAGTVVVLNASNLVDSATGFLGIWADTGGDFSPYEALSNFAGEDSAGAWTLEVEDTYEWQDDGVFHSWGVTAICGSPRVADATDCNDSDDTTYPGAPDTATDGTDQDCDGIDGPDADGDGYTDAATGGDDCDDSESTINPGADEYCNNVDDNCDGVTDENTALDASSWYVDSDGDSFGDIHDAGVTLCAASAAASAPNNTDCDDSDSTIYDGATEICDGQLNDCSGSLPSTETDDDGDFYVECSIDSGGWDGSASIVGGEDCDDSDSAINPSVTEIPGDGTDQNCDGSDGVSFTVSDSTQAFVALQGYSATSTGTVTVTSYGEGIQGWTASADQVWISLSSSSGSNGDEVTITADASSLSNGTHAATITFTDDSTGAHTATIDVTLDIVPSWTGTATQTWTRNALGSPSEVTDADGKTLTFTYDAFGQVTDVLSSLGDSVSYTWNSRGEVSSMTDSTGGTLDLQYNKDGSVEEITWPDGSTSSYSFDADGRVSGMTLPDGATISYDYTTTQILSPDSVTHSVGGTVHYTYDGDGRLATRTLPDGTLSTWTYDSVFGGPASIEHQDSGGTNLLRLVYSYESRGLISEVQITENNATETISYTYDGAGRLIEASSDTNATYVYAYDEGGNRTERSVDGASSFYVYDSDDRLLSGGDTVYEYDQVGRMTRAVSPSGDTRYTYDGFGRLVEVGNGTEAVFYTYSAEGMLLSRETNTGQTTTFTMDLNSYLHKLLAAQLDDGNNIRSVHLLWGGADLAQVDVNGSAYGVLGDHLSSVRGLTDAGGISRYKYAPFGSPTEQPTGLEDGALWMGFTGEYTDPSTSLVYLRKRWYDPSTGRFISPDTLPPDPTAPITWNAYAYCHGDPINFVDPSGERNDTLLSKGLMMVGVGLLGAAAVISAPVTGTVAGIAIAISAASSLMYGAENIAAGLALPPGSDIHVPDGLINGIKDDFKKRLGDDPRWNFVLESLAVVAELTTPDPGKVADLPKDAKKLKEFADTLLLGKKISDIEGGKAHDGFFGAAEDLIQMFKEREEAGGAVFGSLNTSTGAKTNIKLDASFIGDLTQIQGAWFDEFTGQLVLYGEDDGYSTSIDGQMLMSALHWLYQGLQSGGSLEAPGVNFDASHVPTLEPSPPDNVSTWFGVEYYGGIEHTNISDVMFQADQLLKFLSIGHDPDGNDYSFNGLASYWSIYEEWVNYYDGSFPSPSGVAIYLESDTIEMTLDASRDAFRFSEVSFRAGYEDVATSNNTWPIYEDWTTQINDYYHIIAQEQVAWEKLRDVAKSIGLVYWLYETGLHETLNWDTIMDTPPDYFASEWWIKASEDVVWLELPFVWANLTGRANAGAAPTYTSDGGGAVQGYFDQVDAARPSDTDLSWPYTAPDGSAGTAVAIPLADVPVQGTLNYELLEFQLLPLEAIPVAYDSALGNSEEDFGLSAGWTFFPYAAQDNGIKIGGGGPFDVPPTIDVLDFRGGLSTLHFEVDGFVGSDCYYSSIDAPDTTVVLNAAGNITWTQANGTAVVFDEDGYLQSVTGLDGVGMTWTWSAGEIQSVDHDLGFSLRFTSNSDGQITLVDNDFGETWSFLYDTDGLLETVTDERSTNWDLSYDANGLLSTIEMAGTQVLNVTYDDYARVTSRTDLGLTSTIEGSLFDGEVTYTDGAGVALVESYDTDGKLTGYEDGEGGTWSFTYDSSGQLATVTNAEGGTSTHTYNPTGELYSTEDPNGDTRFYFWDYNFEPPLTQAIEYPDGSAHYFARDTDGTVAEIYDVSITHSGGYASNFVVDGYGAMMSWDSTTGQMTDWTRDALSFSASYNSDGTPSDFTSFAGVTRNYAYDSTGRISEVSTNEGMTLGYTYDSSTDGVASMELDGTTVVNIQRDPLGRPISIADAYGNTAAYTYGSDGLLSSAEDPEGGVISYTRDGAGRITGVTGSWGLSQSWSYDNAGRLASTSRTVSLP